MHFSTRLKIKRKTLAAEAGLIRHEEQKVLRSARALNAQVQSDTSLALGKRLTKLGYPPATIKRSLKHWEKTWGQNERSEVRDALYSDYRGLRLHRVEEVRAAARAAHLAHAYLMGMPYARVEAENTQKDYSLVQRDALCAAVAKNIRTFARIGTPEGDAKPKDVAYWMEGGHTLSQEDAIVEAGKDVLEPLAS